MRPARGVRLGQETRTFQPPRLLTDEIDEERNGFVVRADPQIQAGERSARVRIGFADRVRDRLFEMLNGVRDVGVGAALLLLLTCTAVDLRGGDETEHAVRFRIGRRDFQRLLRRVHGFVDLVVPQVQPGQFRGDVRRQRIELHRLLVGGDRAGHVVVLLEMMADEELLVRLSNLRRRRGRQLRRAGARGLSRRHRGHGEAHDGHENGKLHTPELFHKSVKVSYIPVMAVDPELLEILACPHCKTPVTLVKNGTALKCDTCKRVYPIKDDIPVMLIDEATIEP